MISHADCDHPNSSSARAKCRRARAKGEAHTEEGKVQEGATPVVVLEEKERNRGKTPRDRDKQCDICGVERIRVRGMHRWNGMLTSVGWDCHYYLDPEEPQTDLP